MKSWFIYIIVFFGSLLLVVILTAVAIAVKPALFTSGTHEVRKDSTATRVATDSVKAHPHEPVPVVQNQNQKQAPNPTHADTSHVQAGSIGLADSVKNLSSQLDAQRSLVDELNKKLQAAVIHSDSVKARETKNMAKLFESMKAEDAARILNNFSDEEARELIGMVKKRQAGKILGLMSAERAAKIMR
jgi:flagellar motility protein MotE (MotC chaperone)